MNSPGGETSPRLRRLEELAWLLVRIGVIAAPLLCIVGAMLLTLGTDEAWILFGPRGLAEHGQYGMGSPVRTAESTGGAYAVLATLLHIAGGGRVFVVRLLSVLCLTGLIFLIWRHLRPELGRRNRATWVVAAMLLAMPGTLFLGAQAFGAFPATLLMLIGALLHGRLPTGSWRRRLLVGVMFGIAGATRLNCLMGLLGLPIAAAFARKDRRSEFLDGTYSFFTGAVIFLLLRQAISWICYSPLVVEEIAAAYGLTSPFSLPLAYYVPLRLGTWSVGQDLMQITLMVLVTVGWAWGRRRVRDPRGLDFLLAAGWMIWLAWVGNAPIPHLRYLWPAMACIAIVGGVVLALLYRSLGEGTTPVLRLGIPAVALAALAGGYFGGARAYLIGDADTLSWQLQRAARYSYQYGPFRTLRSQKAMVGRIREIPVDENIATVGFDTALAFLTRRQIVGVQAYYPSDLSWRLVHPGGPPPGGFPRWIVITPFVQRFPMSYLPPELYRWIEENCAIRERHGPYVLYEVTGVFPEDPGIFRLDSWEPRLPLVPAD